jgi:hypothetical protein
MQEEMVKALTREEILNADDIVIEKVPVPEWGKGRFVHITTLTALEREKYVESIQKITGHGRKQSVSIVLQQSSAKLASQTICDEKGIRLFGVADIPALAKKSSKALQRIVDAAAKLNGIDDEAFEDAKNDSANQIADSGSNGGSQPGSVVRVGSFSEA